MLLIAKVYSELSEEQLWNVYDGNCDTVWYIQRDFFTMPETMCCVWVVNELYCSILRLEPYMDGYLITGLETPVQFRRNGYAEQLIRSAIKYLFDRDVQIIYSHIENRNVASVVLHKKIGFAKIYDYAKYVDGTISANAATFLISNINRTE